MKYQLLTRAMTSVLPLVLGFLGGVSSTFFPLYFSAFCGGAA
ncbi:hypothetical protein [Pseudogemmobacter humi]|uniref:Uncharacterized protein n=1 Tax=Pseudogemmobacter humi TaxID=2483812 RepID=A0A3P5XT05_9RHOB|nr:hypothetical protein [Pseudogemmobacter humi]VDC33949.1 hypothetical protein XINFAN_04150 [Pseudogemmobacter humi]